MVFTSLQRLWLVPMLLLQHTPVGADFVHVVQDANGTYWLEQNGKQFMLFAINHVNNGGMDDGVGGRESVQCQAAGFANCGDTLSFSGKLAFAPYFNVTQDKYGPDETAWANASIQRVNSFGFNAISGWSATVAEVAAAAHGVYYMHLLDAGVTWLTAWSNGLDWDVWSSNFSTQVNSIALKEVVPRANDPWLIGFQLDNEINWNQVGYAKYLNYPATFPGNAQAIAYLQQAYNNTLAALNKAWNITASSWQNVASHLKDPSLNTAQFNNDDANFIGLVAGQYFKVCYDTIRQYDTNHLMLGVRFAVNTPQIVAAATPYVDIFDQHSYDDLPPISWLQQIHNISGKPVVVGEFSFTALDSNMPNTVGARANNPCTTQTQRAAMWQSFTKQLAPQPWCLGWGHWQFADEPSAGRWPDGEDSNYGLFNLADDTYTIFAAAITDIQTAAPAWHEAGQVSN